MNELLASTSKIKKEMNGQELMEVYHSEVPYLCKPLLPKSGLISIVGKSRVEKSNLALNFAHAVMSSVHTRLSINSIYNRVLYVSLETPISKFINRMGVQIVNNEHNRKRYEKEFDFIPYSLNYIQRVRKKLRFNNYDLVIIDPSSDIFYGSSDARDIDINVSQLNDVTSGHDCTFLFLDHFINRIDGAGSNISTEMQYFKEKCSVKLDLSKAERPNFRELSFLKHDFLDRRGKKKVFRMKILKHRFSYFKITGCIYKESYDSKNKAEVLLCKYPKIVERAAGDLTYKKALEMLRKKNFQVGKGTLARAVKKYRYFDML